MGPVALTLAGLVLDMVGAFILGVEAIGIERVRQWGERATWFTTEHHTFLRRALMVAVLTLAWIVGDISLTDSSYWSWLRLAAVVFVLILAGRVLAASVAFTLLHIGDLLLEIQRRARRQTAGLLGFGFLMTGFALQFGGALWQSVSNSN